jgi:transposase
MFIPDYCQTNNMSYLRGSDRSEVQLLPACLDDYVAAASPARFIDAYAENVDFQALGFARAQPAATGRPPYHPADLLKLYLYGYLHRIRSSRRLEAEATRNLELIWLLRGLRPDFKTIADFRKDNRLSFKALFKQFNLLCGQMGLFGAELVAIDGSKFKADNNSRRYHSQKQLRERIQKLEQRIEEYLNHLDQDDDQGPAAPVAPTVEEMAQKVALLKERKGRYDELLRELEQKQQPSVSLTDPDARPMKGAHGYVLGYNVQVAVDAKHDLIVAQDVVQAAVDRSQLAPMALAAKAELGVKKLQAVADKGYYDTDQLEACEQAGIEPFVPQAGGQADRVWQGRKFFGKGRFAYDARADVYHCPGGQSLARRNPYLIDGIQWIYYYTEKACQSCALRPQCTLSDYRMAARRANATVAERTAARVRNRADLVAARKTIVEHVFGTLRCWNHDHFLMRGLEKVRAEFSLSALVYNLKRVLNLVGLPELMRALHATPQDC